ncbi:MULTISPECIES: hypothetical protein [unclassified Sphingopyxis]|uniref:hypothetical protein n=1 Tax=unclassified Sphingopyxis TaxID=2614943 RepID=UPI0009EAA9EA
MCSSPSHTGKTGFWTRSERWRRDAQRLNQLGRQSGEVHECTFEIELLYPGAQAFAFTFGWPPRIRPARHPSTIGDTT